MSKYRPALYIDINKSKNIITNNAIESEIENYSITPRTLESRSFVNDIDDEIFVDHYKYGKNSVKRFGLNIHSSKLSKEIQKYNQNTKDKLDAKSIVSSTSSMKTSKKAEKDIEDYKIVAVKVLTNLEKDAVKMAISHIKNDKVKTALVDVFERDADNNDVEIENSLPKTHTVVLYEQSSKYLVIDPSNATFSQILVGANDDIRVCFSKKLQIYKAADNNIGSKPNQWRDCIDIAVKLAFNMTINAKLGFDNLHVEELNKNNNIGYIQAVSVKEASSIKEITNQKSMYNKLLSVVDSKPIRIKQSSDTIESKKATSLLVTLDSVFLKVFQTLEDKGFIHLLKVYSKQQDSLVDEIFKEQDYKKCLTNATKHFYDQNILNKSISDMIDSDVKLLAEEFKCIDDLIQ
jgi:hypothetical protein